jgi:hypothetical protein
MYMAWPEVSEDVQFGSPVWRAGKKTFALVHADRNVSGGAGPERVASARRVAKRDAAKRDAAGGGGDRVGKRRVRPRLQLYFWVGVAAQGLMTADERFEIPAYMGHNGWIALDVTEHCDWNEVRGLALASYRHFALQRMLKALDTEA